MIQNSRINVSLLRVVLESNAHNMITMICLNKHLSSHDCILYVQLCLQDMEIELHIAFGLQTGVVSLFEIHVNYLLSNNRTIGRFLVCLCIVVVSYHGSDKIEPILYF